MRPPVLRPARSFASAFQGSDNNFDILRLLAAALVLFGHSFVLTAGRQNLETVDGFSNWLMRNAAFGEAVHEFAVNIFFVISGFLVAYSFQRSGSLRTFVVSRALRIFPAAIACSVVSVIALALVTTAPLGSYFADSQTLAFLVKNAALYSIEYELPGVFEGNAYSGVVNGSLWTLPLELRCYVGLTLLGVTGLLKRKWLFNLVLAVFAASVVVPGWSGWISGDMHKMRLILCFVLGAGFCVNREHIPFGLIPVALILAATILAPKDSGLEKMFYVLLLTYATLGLALNQTLPRINLSGIGDFSYGVYLYAFPSQQLLIHAFPETFSGDTVGAWSLVAAALVLTLTLAALSWHLVEKNALTLKGRWSNYRPRAGSAEI